MDTTSHWLDTATLPRYPRLDRNLNVDVVVIGGGITGITAAYLCRQAGASVALLERERLARIDTGHTTAHLTGVIDLRLRETAKTFGNDAARAVWDASHAAIDQIVRATRTEGIDSEFRWVPGYLHAPDAQPERSVSGELEAEAHTARDLGLEAEYLAAAPLFGGPAVRFPQQALFHPRKYLSGLVRAFVAQGGLVFEKTSADDVATAPLAVQANGHTLQCHRVIVATHNHHAGKVSQLRADLLQTKLALYTSYVLSAKVPGGQPEALFWDTNDPYYYLRLERRRGHDLAIFGGEDHKTGQEENTHAPYERLERRFREIFPTAEIQRRWSGQVIETNDGLPFIGEMSDGQFVSTGYAGNGMTFGTLGAMMAADWVLGRENPWADLFDLHRKKILGGVWSYLKENKDYPYYLVRNLLAAPEGSSLRALKRSEGKILGLGGRKVAAYRDREGNVTCCSPVCTHLKCIVAWNDAEQTWDCPCHGSRFKATGEVISGPAETSLEKLPVPAEE